jgi:hypothetical protein
VSEVQITNLTIGDGQVQTAAAQITTGVFDHARRLNIKFCNVGGQTETLILTMSRKGGTPRRIKRVVLDPNEEFKLGAIPLNQGDSLLAQTTNPASIDYTIAIAGPDANYSEETYDDSGRFKNLPYIEGQLDALNSPTPS